VGPLPFLPICVVLTSGLVAAVTDLRAFKIHNALTIPLLLTGLLYHGLLGGPDGLSGSVLGALFGFGVLFFFYLLGGIGGGDVKLMAGVGAWLGWPLTLVVFVVASVAAGLAGLVLIVANGRVRETSTNLKLLWFRLVAAGRYLGAEDQVETEVRRTDRRQRLIPFGAMIALGTLVPLVWAWLRKGP
jgi:prepilin peptidase CpaA